MLKACVTLAGMGYQWIATRFPLLRWWQMMLKLLGKRDASDCGLTVLELLHMSIMYLRMWEMGEDSLYFLNSLIFCWKLLKFTTSACRWVLLEVLDKVSPGSVSWKQATKPPIKMPFRKVENCNQVVKIGKELNFSLVNVAGNDIVQGNKKLILGKSSTYTFHWKMALSMKKIIGCLLLPKLFAETTVLNEYRKMFESSFFFLSIFMATDEVYHAPTPEKPENSLPGQRDYWHRYSKLGKQKGEEG